MESGDSFYMRQLGGRRGQHTKFDPELRSLYHICGRKHGNSENSDEKCREYCEDKDRREDWNGLHVRYGAFREFSQAVLSTTDFVSLCGRGSESSTWKWSCSFVAREFGRSDSQD